MENLKYLIGAHFHQDWNHVYDSREDSVADFLRRSPSVSARVPAEIDQLLASTTDEELERVLDDFGFDDEPVEGARAFLESVRDQIAEAVLP